MVPMGTRHVNELYEHVLRSGIAAVCQFFGSIFAALVEFDVVLKALAKVAKAGLTPSHAFATLPWCSF